MKESRRKRMEQLLEQRGAVTMQELCDIYDVSMNTVRADVAAMVECGMAEKVYGGVRLRSRREVPAFDSRRSLHTDSKEAIARAAAEVICDGDIVYIDAGTTTMHILDYLTPGKRVTVVTPNITVIAQAAANPDVTLVVLPGMVNRRTNAILDGSTAQYLSRYQHTKAFMGVSALAVDGSLGVSSFQEYELKRTAVSRSREVYLLVDSSKYGEQGLLSYGNALDMAHIFTDNRIPAPFRELCRKNNVDMQIL